MSLSDKDLVSWAYFKSFLGTYQTKVSHIEHDLDIIVSTEDLKCYLRKNAALDDDPGVTTNFNEFIESYKETPVIRRYYASVDATSVDTNNYVPGNGEELKVYAVGGNAGRDPDTKIEIIWGEGGGDEEYLLATNGDADHSIYGKKFTGDGVKSLTIRLRNDQLISDSLGGFWIGGLVSGS